MARSPSVPRSLLSSVLAGRHCPKGEGLVPHHPPGRPSSEGPDEMTIILIIVLVLLLCGGGWGWRTGYWGYGNPLGIGLLVLILLVLFGAFSGPRLGYW